MNGPNPAHENQPAYIDNAIRNGCQVVVDVWPAPAGPHPITNNKQIVFLGSDYPQYDVPVAYLIERRANLFCRVRSLPLLTWLMEMDLHVLFDTVGCYTFTNKGVILAHPGYPITNRTVCMHPERVNKHYTDTELRSCMGIWTDYVLMYKQWLNSPQPMAIEHASSAAARHLVHFRG